MTSRGSIVVAGSVAQRPGQGGHTWVFLQYLLGFRRLGYDVLFLDRLDPAMCRDDGGRPCEAGRSAGLRYLAQVMERFGLGGSFAVACNGGTTYLGLPRRHVVDRVKASAFVLNVMGFFNDGDVLAAAPRRVFLDIDPGLGQMWRELGLSDLFRGHDDFVTVGMNVGRPDCEVPTCDLAWVTTPQPVVLEHWPAEPPPTHFGDRPITSVAMWRGDWGPVEYRGRTYGLRVHEFRKFMTLPRLVRPPAPRFELALDIHPDEAGDIAALDANGWSRRDPLSVCADPWAYREYVRRSAAEFMVAKNLYVQTRGGWFSDRSICYLAAGRPVVAQDTAAGEHFPAGEGLLTFSTVEQAAAAVETIRDDYARHARAARSVAEACFDSDIVLSRLLQKLNV